MLASVHLYSTSTGTVLEAARRPRFAPKVEELAAAAIVQLSDESQKRINDPEPSKESEATAQEKDELDNKLGPEGQELSPEEQQMVRELEARDREVRAHEAAHVAAAGGLAGSPSYSFQTGPDNKQYAVGGEVSIDTSPGRTPEETVMKAARIRAAAVAPADPSGQDMSVAAAATQMEMKARMEISQKVKSPDERGATSDSTPSTQGYGGMGHLHSTTSCGFCSKAVAKYVAAA
jgi:hypothetical protein